MDYEPQSRPHLADIIFPVQSQAADLFPYQFAKLRFHLLGQCDSSKAENGYAEVVSDEYP
jgi:hypothetical protein